MKTNQLPKNGTINIEGLRAEIFFQVVNCDHIAKNFREDLSKAGTKEQYHDVLFVDIKKMLSGYVLFVPIEEATKKMKAVCKYKGKYYLCFFTLQFREDCPTLFAVIQTVYITRHPKDIQDYEQYVKETKEKYGDSA